MQTLLGKARANALADDLLQVEELPAPAELKLLIRLCLWPDVAQRPTAHRLIAGLEHIKRELAQPQSS